MSSGYLLDTNVVSALTPDRADDRIQLEAWLKQNALHIPLFLSVIVFMEIERGITRLERDGSTRRSIAYRQWLTRIEVLFANRIIDVDRHIADLAGQLSGRAQSRGHDPGVADSLIAATAIIGGLTVLTRNGRHFVRLDVQYLDPFS